MFQKPDMFVILLFNMAYIICARPKIMFSGDLEIRVFDAIGSGAGRFGYLGLDT